MHHESCHIPPASPPDSRSTPRRPIMFDAPPGRLSVARKRSPAPLTTGDREANDLVISTLLGNHANIWQSGGSMQSGEGAAKSPTSSRMTPPPSYYLDIPGMPWSSANPVHSGHQGGASSPNLSRQCSSGDLQYYSDGPIDGDSPCSPSHKSRSFLPPARRSPPMLEGVVGHSKPTAQRVKEASNARNDPDRRRYNATSVQRRIAVHSPSQGRRSEDWPGGQTSGSDFEYGMESLTQAVRHNLATEILSLQAAQGRADSQSSQRSSRCPSPGDSDGAQARQVRRHRKNWRKSSLRSARDNPNHNRRPGSDAGFREDDKNSARHSADWADGERESTGRHAPAIVRNGSFGELTEVGNVGRK